MFLFRQNVQRCKTRYIRIAILSKLSLYLTVLLCSYSVTAFYISGVTSSFEIGRWVQLVCKVQQGILLHITHFYIMYFVSETSIIEIKNIQKL